MSIRTQLSLLGLPEASPAPAAPKPAGDGIVRWAEMSPDLRYRWILGRQWAPGLLDAPAPGRLDFWCGVNPSDADGQQDDPSVHRMMAFGRVWGSDGFLLGNLAALISSNPAALYDAADPIGELCDKFIREAAEQAVQSGGRLIVAWGNSVRFDEFAPPTLRGRDKAILRLLSEIGPVYCLARNKDGSPRHPHARGRVRVPDGAQPVLFATKLLEGP